MRPQVILDGLESLQPDEEVTAKQIVQWMIGALEVTSQIPDFTITSAGEVSRAFFKHLHSETAKVVFPFDRKLFVKNFFRVVDAVGRIFDVTIEKETSLQCWIQIGQFMNDLQKHCKNGLFTVVSGAMSASLLKKMIAVPGFNTNKDIIDSMLLHYKCVLAVTDAKNKAYEKQHKKTKPLLWQYLDCIAAFYELIGENLIFSSDAFFPITAQILDYLNGLSGAGSGTLRKYLDAINFSLGSNDEVAKMNMAMFLPRIPLELLLHSTMKMKITYIRRTMINILKLMLEYTREKNIPCEIDWTLVFVYALYWHHDALELLLLETQGTEQDEENRSFNLVERVIQVFLRHNDDIDKLPAQQHLLEQQSADRLINLIKGHIDFVTCETLFSLLRKHVADSPATCAVIILFIDNAAKTLASQPHSREAYVKLMKTVFRHITYVKSHPELLCRLINIFDLSRAKNDEVFCKQLLLAVPEAFHQCSLYGTAFDLLTVLKAVGYDHDKLMDLFEKLLSDETSGNRRMETLTLLLAANDIFDVFKILNPHDRRRVFDYFKKRFEGASDDAEVLYASLMIHMLVAFQSTPDRFPGEARNTVENEARHVYRFLSNGINAADQVSFAAVHLGIAICVYYSTFQPTGGELIKSFSTLTAISILFRLNYDLDAKKDAILNDLRLVSTFWRSAINVYKQTHGPVYLPTVIFEAYPRMEIHTVAAAEEFLLMILERGDARERFALFVESMYYLLEDLKKRKVNPIVNKLFKFVAKTESGSDVTKIAAMFFIKNLQFYCINFPRPKVVRDVQINLYKNLVKSDENNIDYRKEVMEVLSAKIDAQEEGPARKCFEELRQYLLNSPNAENAPENEATDEEMREDVEVPDVMPESRRGTGHSERRSNSLIGVDMSIIQPQ